MQQKGSGSASRPTSSQDNEVVLNILFFDSRYPSFPLPITLTQSVFNRALCNARGFFAEELLNNFGFQVHLRTIWFRLPKQPLPVKTTLKEGWRDTVTNLKEFAQLLPLTRTISKAVARDAANKELVHLILTTNEFQGTPEFRRYNKIVSTPGRTPSEGAQLTQYGSVQSSEGEVIYNGRYPSNHKTPTIAPPVSIFHPIFTTFLGFLEDPGRQPSPIDLRCTRDFMYNLCEISESRTPLIREQLEEMLQVPINEVSNADITTSDAVYFLELGPDNRVPIFIVELKSELGEGGCDPSTQVAINMRRSWILKEGKAIREKSCCPTLMLAGAGPWLTVLGGVLTDKVIVQHLTDMKWAGLASTEEESQIYYVARLLLALRESFKRLQNYYCEIFNDTDIPRLSSDEPHARFYPYPTSFFQENREIKFRYLEPLEKSDATCVTFRAQILAEDGRPTLDYVVVKFVSRYGEAAHVFLAENGHAPALRHYGPLAGTSPSPMSPLIQNAPSGLCMSQRMFMVVMDYIVPKKKVPSNRLKYAKEVKAILTKLHCEGYVFGDLRDQNIIIDSDDSVKLIDFNWCGPYDMTLKDDYLLPEYQVKLDENSDKNNQGPYTHYPLSISRAISWPIGAGPLRPIRPRYDCELLERLSWGAGSSVTHT